MESLITSELIALDRDLGASPDAVIRSLAAMLGAAGRATDVDGLVADVMAREHQAATGLPGGIAIPHCRSAHVTTATLGFARLRPAVNWGEGATDLAFMIAAPTQGDADHMKLLTALARALVRDDFKQDLRAASTAEEVAQLVADAVAPDDTDQVAANDGAQRSLVAVTACPTGIAHTYMAADALEQAAADAGVEIHVETQGSTGMTPLTAHQIAAAEAVILAADVEVGKQQRFVDMPVVTSTVKRAIGDAASLVAEALEAADNPEGERVAPSATGLNEDAPPSGAGILRRWLRRG